MRRPVREQYEKDGKIYYKDNIGMGNPIYDEPEKTTKMIPRGQETKKESCEVKQAKANKCRIDKIK